MCVCVCVCTPLPVTFAFLAPIAVGAAGRKSDRDSSNNSRSGAAGRRDGQRWSQDIHTVTTTSSYACVCVCIDASLVGGGGVGVCVCACVPVLRGSNRRRGGREGNFLEGDFINGGESVQGFLCVFGDFAFVCVCV